MSVDAADIDRLAELARLELSAEERARLPGELERILDYVRQLQSLDVEDVPPTKHVIDLADVTRADEPRPSLPRATIEEMAPEEHDGHFVVPLVLPG